MALPVSRVRARNERKLASERSSNNPRLEKFGWLGCKPLAAELNSEHASCFKTDRNPQSEEAASPLGQTSHNLKRRTRGSLRKDGM
jgi:hypothetical protein